MVAKGSVEIEGTTLNERDGAAISKTAVLSVLALEDTEVVLVDTVP